MRSSAAKRARSCSSSEGWRSRKPWSQQATNIVVSKYFRGHVGSPDRERSVKQLIGRVVETIAGWARKQKYFASEEALQAFSDDLKHLLVEQKAAFNSPVWFNCGFEKAPQCSACFINSVDDTMESILTLAKTEGMLFKYGSGTGSNLSSIRSAKELLAGGGTASGPVSFMKGFDAFAGVIKSGGKTRRAAKMVILNADHPDVVEFINCKVEEEKKAWALIDAGYDGSFTGAAYSSVFFQNSNNSVRVSDEFMRAVLDDGLWQTRAVTTGEVMDTYRARDLMRLIAEGTWVCGDPGMQFDTTVNEWHTCPNTARINASNPCSEYMFLDDSACNLSSINLMKFVRRRRRVRRRGLPRRLPHPDHRAGDHRRQLQLPDQGDREEQSRLPAARPRLREPRRAADGARPALRQRRRPRLRRRDHRADDRRGLRAVGPRGRDHGGPFAGYDANREPFLRVMRKHRDAIKGINQKHVPADLYNAAKQAWDDAVELGEDFGYRNAQATVLAPTGTIGFMMDCDTTGIEPDIALVKYKKLVGGGMMKIVNQTVPMALKRLGYTAVQIDDIIKHIDEQETIEGAPHLLERDLPVFDCAFKAAHGERSIHYMGHIKMMGATQPFISGAICKTVNVPKDATVEDIEQAYLESWRLGARPSRSTAMAASAPSRSIPRRKSKAAAPLPRPPKEVVDAAVAAALAARRRCAGSCRTSGRRSPTSSTSRATRATSPSGSSRTGCRARSSWSWPRRDRRSPGFADAFAQAISYALQYGVPLQALVDKFSHVRFEPSGMTKNPDVRFAKSIVDYIFRWMASKFLSPEAQFRAGVNNRDEVQETKGGADGDPRAEGLERGDRHRDRQRHPRGRAGLADGRDAEPGGRAALHDLRVDHGAERVLLQVQQLRNDERLRLMHGRFKAR